MRPQPMNFYNHLPQHRINLIKQAATLLIDEISMVSADLLDTIDNIPKVVRNNHNPFGGLRVIFLGDIFQLQPFIPNNKKSKRLLKKLYP
jgi:hypothetical protein